MSTPLLVVTVAAATVAELRRRRDSVVGADLVELRLDSVSDPDVAGALRDRRSPVVVTCRARWEGGAFQGSEDERIALLRAALDQGAEYVDVEFASAFHGLLNSTGGKRIVLSSHDFDVVPSDLPGRLRAMRATGAEIVKIAVTTRDLAQTLKLFALDRGANTVLIGMGAAGVATRLLAAHFGSCWSYAGDGHAPGQIPAATMLDEFRFRKITDQTAVYGVTGSPLTHSISPALHNAVFGAAGVDAVYLPLVASSAEDFLAFARELGVKGASVTIPYKQDLFRLADHVDALSTQVGAVNTLRREDDGWHARNTDVDGFLAPLRRRLELHGARAAVLGAGGAARAVVVGLASAGSAVTVYGRDRTKADTVARIVNGTGASLPVPGGSWDLLVNATPAGMSPDVDQTPFPHGPFDGRVVYDLVYNPVQTRFLREAAAAGCDVVGGLDMLIAQAEAQSEWWLGQKPPADLMRQVAQASL